LAHVAVVQVTLTKCHFLDGKVDGNTTAQIALEFFVGLMVWFLMWQALQVE